MRVFETPITVNHKQTRRILRLDRPQGDVFFGQVEVEGRQIGQETPLFHHHGDRGQIANRCALGVCFVEPRQPFGCIGALYEGLGTV